MGHVITGSHLLAVTLTLALVCADTMKAEAAAPCQTPLPAILQSSNGWLSTAAAGSNRALRGRQALPIPSVALERIQLPSAHAHRQCFCAVSVRQSHCLAHCSRASTM